MRLSPNAPRERMDPQFLAEFKVRLALTIYWCEEHGDVSSPASSLRTIELCPHLLEVDRVYTVQSVADRRTYHGGPEVMNAKIPDDLAGRLLVYFPNGNLACGAAEVETDGFFDIDNVPPWDTWVTYIQDARHAEYDSEYLVAWVPRDFVELADQGVKVNPEECIQWLADTSLELAVVLRNSGFFNQTH